ncbi:MAG: peptidoglycan-binding protein [Phormidesmis sp.]
MEAVTRRAVSTGAINATAKNTVVKNAPVNVQVNRLKKPTLMLGSTHTDVTELQALLGQYVTPLVTGGLFESRTDYAVRLFQYRMFLKEDGRVGPQTWFALYTGTPVNMPTLQLGSAHPAVKLVQETLRVASFGPAVVDGRFGDRTQRSVTQFQAHMGITADAVVGPSTWHALSKARLENPIKPIRRIRLHSAHTRHQWRINDIAIATAERSETGDVMVATAGNDTTVRLWRANGDPVDPAYVGDRGRVSSVAFHPSRPQFISATFGGTIRVTSFSLQTLAVFPARGGGVEALAVDPAGQYIATATGDNAVRLFNFRGDLLRELVQLSDSNTGSRFGSVRSVAISAQGQLAIASRSSGVSLWDHPLAPQSARFSPVLSLPFTPSANLVQFNPSGYKLAVTNGRQLKIYSNQRHLLSAESYPDVINALSFSDSGRYLALGCQNNKVYILDLLANNGAGKIVFELEGHDAPISAVRFGSSPENYFYSADVSGRLIAWRIAKYELAGMSIAENDNSMPSPF